MKVACVGNMNHIFFSLVRFLRDRNLSADLLLVDDEYPHFHPSCDSFSENYRAYTIKLEWGSASSFFRVGKRRVLQDLSAYDVILGCGFAPAFCEKIGRRLDIFVPFGMDIYLFPFGISREHWWKRYPGRYLSGIQRRGIEKAEHIFCPNFYGPARNALEKLGVEYEAIPCTPVYYPEYEHLTEPSVSRRLAWKPTFDALRSRHDFLLFSPARQFWQVSLDVGLGCGKGNDLLMRGVADYIRRSGNTGVGLALFEYGDDVAASKALAKTLGISECIHWFPKMPRREIMYGAACCDAGADQFPGKEQSGAYAGSAIELMSLGKPVFGQLFYSAEEFLQRTGFPMPPILNSPSEEAVAEQLAGLVKDPEKVGAIGRESRRWTMENYGSKLVDRYIAVIEGHSRKFEEVSPSPCVAPGSH